jgi:hypothetical protein
MEPLKELITDDGKIHTAAMPSEKKTPKAPERVSLTDVEAKKLDHWLGLAREASKGFLTLSRSDLVSFLIGEHRTELSPSEIKRLRAIHYDAIKHIQWIMPQIKAALTLGDVNRVAELQCELRGVELSIVPPGVLSNATVGESGGDSGTRKPKKRIKKLDQDKPATDSS